MPSQDPGRTESQTKTRLNEVALNSFCNICDEWKISDSDRIKLAGCALYSTQSPLKNAKTQELPHETLERISHILGIYKSLHIIFINRDQANSWISRSNSDFNNKSALQVMLCEEVTGIIRVRSYLEALIT